MIIIRWFERKEYLSYEAIVKVRNNLPRLMKRMKIMKTGMKYRDLRVLAMFPYWSLMQNWNDILFHL